MTRMKMKMSNFILRNNFKDKELSLEEEDFISNNILSNNHLSYSLGDRYHLSNNYNNKIDLLDNSNSQ